uniref:Cytochrome P450 n=1 Tax=Bionectria ochroleuca TaxID=29856 RepID=A0A8H7K419_BIOOC
MPVPYVAPAVALLSSPSTVACAIVLATSTLAFRRLRSPFPGPRLLKLTSIPLQYHELTGSREAFVEALHQKFGPLVQVAPRHVSANDLNGLRDISVVSQRLDRPDPLLAFHNYGKENLVSTVRGDVHHERRKPLRSMYSAKMAASKEVTDVTLRAARDMLLLASPIGKKSPGGGAVVEIRELLRPALYDAMSFIVYGPNSRLNLVNDQAQRTAMEVDTEFQVARMSSAAGAMMFLLPRITLWLRRCGLAPGAMDGTTPSRLFSDRIGREALEALKRTDEKGGGGDGYQSLMGRLYAHFRANGPTTAVPSEEYILSDSLDQFWAGVSTTADGLAPLFRRLSLPENRTLQQRLRSEIRAAIAESGVSSAAGLTAERLKRLPLLNAVIRETLRIHPPIPFSMERKIVNEQGLIVHGQLIPAGWQVSAEVMAMQRKESVFDDAGRWVPDRWLTTNNHKSPTGGSKDVVADMKGHFLAFGSGSRMCLGMNVAWGVMRAFVAVIYGEMQTSIVQDHVEGVGGHRSGEKDPETSADGVAGWLEERQKTIRIHLQEAAGEQ